MPYSTGRFGRRKVRTLVTNAHIGARRIRAAGVRDCIAVRAAGVRDCTAAHSDVIRICLHGRSHRLSLAGCSSAHADMSIQCIYCAP